MNYDEAREFVRGGWRWSTMNDGVIRTAPPCIRFAGDTSNPYWYMQPTKPSDWEYCEDHATREEAERHYYDWCLSTVEEIKLSDQLLQCRADGCEVWTDTELGNRQLGRMFSGDPLCEAHRNRETLMRIRPFTPRLRIVHS